MENVIVILLIAGASIYLARMFWYRTRIWRKGGSSCHTPAKPKPSRPQQLTINGKSY